MSKGKRMRKKRYLKELKKLGIKPRDIIKQRKFPKLGFYELYGYEGNEDE